MEGVLVAEFFTFALWYTVHKFPGILDCFGYGYTVESSPAKIPVSELLVVYTTVGNPVNWNLCRIPDAAGLRARQIFNLAGYRSKLPEALWWGQGSLEALYMPLQAEWFREHSVSAYANVAGNNVYAFNEFLRILFETGIAGFVLFVLLIFTGCRHSFRGNQTSRDAGSVFLAILSFGFFSYPFSIGLIITIAVAALAVIAGNVSSPVLIKGRWKTGYRFVAGLFLLSLPVFICFEYRQEKRADRLLSEAQSVLTGTGMMNSYRYLQGNADFVLCYGKTLFNHRQYAEALPVLENACALKPSSRLVCDLGMCYQQAGRNAEAEKAYLSASFMTPAYIVPHYHLFNLYRADGSPGQAAIQAEYMLSMQVKVVNTSVLRIRNQARIFLQNYRPKE